MKNMFANCVLFVSPYPTFLHGSLFIKPSSHVLTHILCKINLENCVQQDMAGILKKGPVFKRHD